MLLYSCTEGHTAGLLIQTAFMQHDFFFPFLNSVPQFKFAKTADKPKDMLKYNVKIQNHSYRTICVFAVFMLGCASWKCQCVYNCFCLFVCSAKSSNKHS